MLALTKDGLHIPAPSVVDWAEAIDAHIAQSEGRSRGKQSYVCDTFTGHGKAHQRLCWFTGLSPVGCDGYTPFGGLS